MFKKILLLLFITSHCLMSFAQTNVQKTNDGYVLLRDGKPYYIKGVGGEVNFDQMVAIGANSFRLWGVENARKSLDEAQKRGLTVMLGFWLQPERQGFDYNNAASVKKQFDYFKTIVDKYKDDPALLLWGIGNELDLDYTNPNVWYAVQDLAKYIHQVDPNHPTSTVTAGIDSMKVQYIKNCCPDIDIFGINTYGNIASVPKNIAYWGWTGPYIITEWGPNGHWESPQTAWGVSIEQTSTEKRESYHSRFRDYIEANKNYCLGSYAFSWAFKQEYTETWYGLFTKDNKPTEAIDALQKAFTGKEITNPAPSIIKFTIDNKIAKDNINLKAEEKYSAEVITNVGLDSNVSGVKYTFRIMEESTDKKSGGDAEKEAAEITGLIKKGNAKNQISFRAPDKDGLYRLFVSAIYNGKVAYANIPFKVNARTTADGQSKFIKMKYTDMKSFQQ